MVVVVANRVVVGLDDEVVEVLGVRSGKRIGLTVDSKDLLTASLRLSHRADTLTEGLDEEGHERRDTILLVSSPELIVRPEGVRIVRLSIDIEAIVAVLIDEVTDRISILDDSGTAGSLTFFRLFGAPAPVLVRPSLTILK